MSERSSKATLVHPIRPERDFGPFKRRARRFVAQLRWIVTLTRRFRFTLGSVAALFVLAPILFAVFYVESDGTRIGYGKALHHVYFLMFGEPSLPYTDHLLLEALNLAIPPFGVAVVLEGLVRFVLLAVARQRNDKEWVAVISSGFVDHVIVCGAGRIGHRVALQLRDLGRDVVVIEKREDGPFVAILRDHDVPVLIDDIRSKQCLDRVNAKRAAAIVCSTDDDLANMNVALDARRLNPSVRMVMRMFDEDLAATVRHAFGAETLSTSAVAAPVMAYAAIDPSIIHSFRVGAHVMVVSELVADHELARMTVGDVRDRFFGMTLGIKGLDGHEKLHPPGAMPIAKGDVLVVQAEYADYLALRSHLGNDVAVRTLGPDRGTRP